MLLDVTNNGHDWSHQGVPFTFTQCPAGSHCPATQILPCPAGASCDGLPGYNVTRCLPGTYQPESGVATCRPCPQGTFCPALGTSRPMVCSPGMVCSQIELKFPDALCPAGHFCPPGTATTHPFSPTELLRPIE